jgi:hypothetical protein
MNIHMVMALGEGRGWTLEGTTGRRSPGVGYVVDTPSSFSCVY